jgi:hypothetical protein
MAMYLFTDNIIDERLYEYENQRMFIRGIKSNYEEAVFRWNEGDKNVYYIGSYEGCGCGWRSTRNDWGNRDTEDDRRDIYNRIIDRRKDRKSVV